MPYFPIVIFHDPDLTGFQYSVALPDQNGIIFKKEGPKKGKQSQLVITAVHEISQELALGIEHKSCDTCNDAAIKAIQKAKNENEKGIEEELEELQALSFSEGRRITPKIYLFGHTNGILGLAYFVNRKTLTKIEKAASEKKPKLIRLLPAFNGSDIVISDRPESHVSIFDIDAILKDLDVPEMD